MLEKTRYISAAYLPEGDGGLRQKSAIIQKAHDNGFTVLRGQDVPEELRAVFPAGTYMLGYMGGEALASVKRALLFLSGSHIFAVAMIEEEPAFYPELRCVPIAESLDTFGRSPEDYDTSDGSKMLETVANMMSHLYWRDKKLVYAKKSSENL